MLRPAEERDVDAMREWRNQPANREVSLNQHEITSDEHLAWWARVRDDDTKRVLVFEHTDRPLGIVNFFDVTPTSAGWGFFLDNETLTAEGTAMMAWMQVMKDATNYAFDELGLDVLEAEVFEDNEAVRMMNRRFRFVEGPPEPREINGRQVNVIQIALRREDRRTNKGKA